MKKGKMKRLLKEALALASAANARLDELETAVYGLPSDPEFHPDFIDELLGSRSKDN